MLAVWGKDLAKKQNKTKQSIQQKEFKSKDARGQIGPKGTLVTENSLVPEGSGKGTLVVVTQ